MIYILVTARHRYTVDLLHKAYPGPLPVRIASMPYEELGRGTFSEPATFIFTDLERLTATQLESAAEAWRALARSGRAVRMLNHPLLVMRRYELLRELFEREINDFDVYRLTEARPPRRYPVFIRGEDDHRGSQTKLLHTRAELNEAIGAIVQAGKCRDARMIAEFRETVDARGYYLKYAAFAIGRTVVPDHLMFGRRWIVKNADVELLTDELRAEEYAYVKTNPHADMVRQVFEIARVDYGRLDYGLVDGRMVVFELNTNPWIHHEDRASRHARFPDLTPVTERLVEALAALDPGAGDPHCTVELAVD